MTSGPGGLATDAVFVDCDLRKADFYAATLERVGFYGCDLAEAELAKAAVTAMRLERSTIAGVTGIGGLRNVVLGPEQVPSFAPAFLAAHGISVAEPED